MLTISPSLPYAAFNDGTKKVFDGPRWAQQLCKTQQENPLNAARTAGQISDEKAQSNAKGPHKVWYSFICVRPSLTIVYRLHLACAFDQTRSKRPSTSPLHSIALAISLEANLPRRLQQREQMQPQNRQIRRQEIRRILPLFFCRASYGIR